MTTFDNELINIIEKMKIVDRSYWDNGRYVHREFLEDNNLCEILIWEWIDKNELWKFNTLTIKEDLV